MIRDEMIDHGINLNEAVRKARELGCEVKLRPGTGEITVTHPSQARPVQVNNRNKSAPRSFTTLLRKIQQAKA